MLIKKDLVDSLIGAAEKMKYSHWSNPKFYFILLKTNFLAKPQADGKVPPFTYAYVPWGDLLFAQSAIFLFNPVVWAPIAAIFYSIFSHNLGTVIKIVLNKIK